MIPILIEVQDDIKWISSLNFMLYITRTKLNYLSLAHLSWLWLFHPVGVKSSAVKQESLYIVIGGLSFQGFSGFRLNSPKFAMNNASHYIPHTKALVQSEEKVESLINACLMKLSLPISHNKNKLYMYDGREI